MRALKKRRACVWCFGFFLRLKTLQLPRQIQLKVVLGLLLMELLLANQLYAQKFGYIDSEYVMRQMPTYRTALSRIDSLAKAWESKIKAELKATEEEEAKLSREEVLLTEEMIEDRRYKIDSRRREAEAQKEEIFGYEGLYFLKEKELLEPLQDELYKAIEEVSKKHRIQLMLDKAHPGILYVNPVHDYTEYILERLGLSQTKPTTQK